MRSAIAALSFSLLCCYASAATDCTPPEIKSREGDYYWRDYFGAVPKDAVEGGYTETGNRTYVGHMGSYKHIGVFPVYIIPGRRGAVAALSADSYEDTYIQILCGGSPSNFEWKNINVDEMHLLTDYHVIPGGVQGKTVTYIGRANFEGQVQVGRIHTRDLTEVKGLWLFNKAGVQTNFRTFEILVLRR